MNRKTKRIIIQAILLVVGLYFGFLFFGSIVHETSHALMCILFGYPFTYSLFSVTYLADTNWFAQIIVALAGGIGQGIFALVFFESTALLEKKGLKWFSVAIPLEIAFLTVAIMGFFIAIWEGFFTKSYIQYNAISFFVTLSLGLVISAFYIIRAKSKEYFKLILA